MPITKADKEFANYIVDLMQSIGPVQAKAMFGGFGLFIDGLMFALIANRELYLKVDNDIEAEFEAKGLEAFRYSKGDKEFKMSYRQAPEEVLENIDEMSLWGSKAYHAALRAGDKKSAKKKAPRKKSSNKSQA